MARPRLKPDAEREMNSLQERFDEFNDNVKKIEPAGVSGKPFEETEPQVKMSQKEIEKSKKIYLKPIRTIYPSPHPKTGKAEEFNEKFRKEYEFRKEYVQFIAENHEIIGESIQKWTRPYGGLPAEEWEIPVNKPVWGPRYLAEEISNCGYSVFSVEDKATSTEGGTVYYGVMKVEKRKPRLSASPVRGGEFASNFG